MFSLPAALVAMAIAGTDTGRTVLLDFYSDTCGPCRAMMPTVDQLAAKGYPVQRVNVAQYPDVVRRLGITGVPCFVMVVNGREAGRVVGATSLGRLEQLCSLGRPAAAPNTMLAATAPAATLPASTPHVPVAPVSYAAAPRGSQPASDAAMLSASVRLRVEDPHGYNCGSGTIIDAMPGGEALVLTCGHLFRDSQGQGKVEVDVFGPAPVAHLPGRVYYYDLERDVALVVFRPQGAVTVARVAPRGYSIQPGDAVTSVGCDDGHDPTVQHSRVNAMDKFQDPVEQRLGRRIAEPHAPWNVEVAGEPVEGRSGGGLFSADGMVIGVCNAAEPVDHEGLYAALGSIQAALDQKRLTSLYQQPIAAPRLVAMTTGGAISPAASDPFSVRNSGRLPSRISGDDAAAATPPAAIAADAAAARRADAGPATLSGSEQVTLEEIRRKLREGSEVVCIIRDRNDPKSQSEVITLDRASPIFVNQLSRAAQASSAPHETSLEVAKRRMPILEWDAESGFLHQSPLPQ